MKREIRKVNIKSVKSLVNSYDVEIFDHELKKLITRKINEVGNYQNLAFHRYVVFHFLHSSGMSLQRISMIFDKSSRRKELNHATIINGLNVYNDLTERKDDALTRVKDALEPLLKLCYDSVFVEQSLPPEQLGFNTTEIAIMNCETVYDLVSYKAKLVEQLSLAQINGKRL